MLAAVPRAPPMASIARYNKYMSVRGLAERNGRTERVRAYPSVCSMGFVRRLRFKLFHPVDEGAIALLPSEFWSPTPVGNWDGMVLEDRWIGWLTGKSLNAWQGEVVKARQARGRPHEALGRYAPEKGNKASKRSTVLSTGPGSRL
jgi:hypothetical protein